MRKKIYQQQQNRPANSSISPPCFSYYASPFVCLFFLVTLLVLISSLLFFVADLPSHLVPVLKWSDNGASPES
jgi:hypothetical protein